MYVWILQHSTGRVYRVLVPEDMQTDYERLEEYLTHVVSINLSNCSWMQTDVDEAEPFIMKVSGGEPVEEPEVMFETEAGEPHHYAGEA